MKREWLYNSGDCIYTTTGAYIIIARVFKEYCENNKIRHRRMYKCRCVKDNYEFEITQTQVNNGTGCPVCGHRLPVLGINTLYDEHKEILKYVSENDAKNVCSNSNKYIECICPNCNKSKRMWVANLVKNGFNCDYCSDGISYPNKFVREFLNQLSIDFVPEKSFVWSNCKVYDQYIENKSIIIENHGRQHYQDVYDNCFNRDDMKNDEEKRIMAKNNGIKHYIELNCSISKLEFIKNSIMNSELPKLLNFKEDDIDWNKCENMATTSLVKQVWEDWNKTSDYKYMIEKYKMTSYTIRTYIKKGYDIGICKKEFYFNDDHSVGNALTSKEINAIPLYCIDDDIYFFSSSVAAEYYNKYSDIKYTRASISRSACNNIKYHGKQFIKITKQQFNKLKDLGKTNIVGNYFNEKYFKDNEFPELTFGDSFLLE